MKLSMLILNLIILSVCILAGHAHAQTHAVDGEYIKEWLVLGPFFPNDLETDFLVKVGGETNINPQEGDTVVTVDRKTLTWKLYKSKENFVDLIDALGYHENAVAYAFCILQSETKGDFSIRFGSDDGVFVWINGKKIHSNPYGHARGFRFDANQFDADLKADTNPCLVKVSQKFSMGDWGFAMRLLPPNRAVISGVITDESGKSIPNAVVRLEQNEEEIAEITADTSGSYRLDIYPVRGQYDLAATSDEKGNWELGIRLREGERRKLNLTLKKAISIEGTLLMLDDKTPHVAVPVQAISNGKVIDGMLSDENGKYRFVNLKPGRYQVRCQTLDGYIYHSESEVRLQDGLQPLRNEKSPSLQVERGKILKNIDFHFPPFKKGTWQTYSYLDGLDGNLVNSIYCDHNGVMWFGTESGGVSRYDGKEFKNFTTKDGLANNDVFVIHGDHDGVLWFGTRGGISRYDGQEFKNFTTQDGLASNVVNSIYGTADGVLWFGTGWIDVPGNGVSRYDGNQFKNFTTKDGLADNTVVSIYCTADGAMWFGTCWGGVSRYDGNEFVTFTSKDGLANNHIFAIYGEPDGVLWFGTFWSGVSRYDGKEFRNFDIKDGLAHSFVQTIYRDSDGVVWFGTGFFGQRGDGVSRYDGRTFVNFTTQDGLVHNVVRSIYCTSDGVLWFGTDGGVSKYDEKGVLNLTIKDGLVDNNVRVIYRTSDDVLWFGTDEGASRYDGKFFKNFTPKDGLAGGQISSILCDPNDVVWFGTLWSGVSRYDGKEFKNFTPEDGLAHYWVYDLYCDSGGVMWFGTYYGGVSRYDGNQFKNFTTEDGLEHNAVMSISRDSDGVMWFGTQGGVSRYDGKEFKNFTTEDGLAHNHVWCIHSNPDGSIWFGTRGGISRYDGKEFKNFSTEDGLAHNAVNSIYCDTDNIMWFGTNGGVSRYDGINWTSLDTRDGLADNNVQSICQNSDGSLWFGTDGGITRYCPSTNPPKVRIVSVKTNREHTEPQTIPPITTGNRVTIKYSAIDFKTVPEKRLYRYRIKELDDDPAERDFAQFIPMQSGLNWCRPTKETSFDDFFDKPGAYTFEVQAIDRDLNYSEPASLTLKVMLPFYMRAGFLVPTVGGGTILLAALAVSLIFLFKRHRQVRAYERAAVQELRDAKQVQMSLMPETAPEIEGIEIASKCLPANTVSGDFFDYLAGKNPNEIGLVVADITGKAMKGAMNAVMADGVLRATAKAQKQLSPASLMAEINDVLKVSMEWGMNVTMVIATINAAPNSGEFGYTLTLANAAHHAYPLLLRDGKVQILKGGGLPLGMRAGVEYTEEQFPLESGDVIILMTDGIIEAQNTKEQLYSDSGRLEETVSQFTQDLPAEAMVDAIITDAIDFGGNKTTRDARSNARLRLNDDMTVVVAKIR